MADVDKSSKTEPPTEKKLSEARSHGQFAKAPEIAMTATLCAGLLVLFFGLPPKQLTSCNSLNRFLKICTVYRQPKRDFSSPDRLFYCFGFGGLANACRMFFCRVDCRRCTDRL